MEDDDDFGDLYTDVPQPLATSFQSQAGQTDVSMSYRSRPIDRVNSSDDEGILYGAPDPKNSSSNFNPAPGLKIDASVKEKTLTEAGAVPERGRLDLNLDANVEASRVSGGYGLEPEAGGLANGDGVKLPEKRAGESNFMEEDDDLNIVVEERDKDDDLVEKEVKFIDKQENAFSAAEQNEGMVNFMGAGAAGEISTEQMIPGLSGKLGNQGGPNFEDDWESDDSEDDLQIVLNDNHRQMGMERMATVDDEDDEEGDSLVIVAPNGDLSHHPMMMEDQEWVGEEGGPGVDGERKELGDAAKASGGGGTAAPTTVQPKIGYSNHMYHHPFHSQFKYVRPGAAPIPGPAPVTPGGTQGQARPPISMGPVLGRGRGDLRPAGVKGSVPMQKGLHSNYGMPTWGANAAGRGYGSGLDFTLPSHKTIFEVDIDIFEEKPWRLPGVDISDFFNFGLNEESWKDYSKQLEQLRLETTMQSKIRVYESGRAEQDYDPDLPPELAAAAGVQDIPSENANRGNADAGATALGKGTAHGRPPAPIGRPIPVETGSGERLPSIDTRRPRLYESDVVIVVICQNSTDDDDDIAEQQDNDQAEEDVIDDLQQDDVDRTHRISHAYNGQKRELVARREQLKNTAYLDKIGREDDFNAVSEAPVRDNPDRETDLPNEERSAKGRGSSKVSKMTASDDSGKKKDIDDQNESFNSENEKRNPCLSSSSAIGSDGEQAVAVVDDGNDISGMDNREKDVSLDASNIHAHDDGKLKHGRNKQKNFLHVEQISEENDNGEDTKASGSSDNSKARSGSSKDQREFHDTVEDEVLQDKHHSCAGNSKRPVGDEDNFHRRSRHGRDEVRKHVAMKEREDSHSRRGGDPNSSLHRHMKSESTEWRKESDLSEGSWRRRDEDLHGRRVRVEDTRKRDHGGEISSRNKGKARESERGERDEHHHSRSQLDSDSLRGSNYDQGTGSRQRGRGDNSKIRNEKVDDLHNKRRREGAYIDREQAEIEDITYNHREGSSRRKRERDDSSDQRKTDGYAKLKDDMRYVRQEEEGSQQKERGERQRERDEWHRHKQSHEEILPRREREETRQVMRSGRPVDDKMWTSQSRGKDDYRGSGREYHKDVGRHSDQLKRRDRVENESSSQHKGREDVYDRGNQGSTDEKRARYERLATSDERVAYASDTSRLRERKQEGSRQGKESEIQDPSSLVSTKRNQDEYSGPISETLNPRGENETRANRHSSRKHGEDALADDEQSESRRGRSKLERWTSHKERDLGVAPVTSSLNKNKDTDTYNNAGPSPVIRKPEEPSGKVERDPQPSVDNKDTGGETNNATAKAAEGKNLDTVEKLKKRSERFKLPMPSEKEALAIKKMESEPLHPAQTENRPDSEIKSERPARKRRWTGN